MALHALHRIGEEEDVLECRVVDLRAVEDHELSREMDRLEEAVVRQGYGLTYQAIRILQEIADRREMRRFGILPSLTMQAVRILAALDIKKDTPIEEHVDDEAFPATKAQEILTETCKFQHEPDGPDNDEGSLFEELRSLLCQHGLAAFGSWLMFDWMDADASSLDHDFGNWGIVSREGKWVLVQSTRSSSLSLVGADQMEDLASLVMPEIFSREILLAEIALMFRGIIREFDGRFERFKGIFKMGVRVDHRVLGRREVSKAIFAVMQTLDDEGTNEEIVGRCFSRLIDLGFLRENLYRGEAYDPSN